MALSGGYVGKVLKVDLGSQSVTEESLSRNELKMLLGGRGLAALLYYRYIMPEAEPLAPENRIIFMTGPLTGVHLPCTTKFQLATRSPMTGIYLCSNSSGNFGPYLKQAGYDALVIAGKAREWTYLEIVDDRVTFHDARRLLGMSTFKAQKALKESVKKGRYAAISIGPAGEDLSMLACVGTDERFFGRGGAGAVMGSKLLKGIVVHGSGTIPVVDPEKIKKINKQAINNLKQTRATHTEQGTLQFLEPLNELGCLPTRNFQSSYFEGAKKIDAHAMVREYLVKNTACYRCSIACGKLNEVKEGPFTGARAKTEYETVAMLGSNCGIDDFGAIVKAAQICDEFGIDTISTGNAVALTMELFEREIITLDDTEGIDAKFGNPHALVGLIQLITEKRGIGELLSEGMGGVLKKKPEWSPYILAVKGHPLAAYDPRGFHGNALTFGTASRGACHNVGGWTVRAELFSEEYDRYGTEGKGKLVKQVQDSRAYVDSLGICTVARKSMGFSDAPEGKVLEAVTGHEFTPHLLEIGCRVYTLERIILNREGITRKDDGIPHRIMKDPVKTGPSRGHVVTREMYNAMLDEYYEARGWDEDGVVKEETLKDLGLHELLPV
jgi:aldehyde:ferredoxin oxidoreductase